MNTNAMPNETGAAANGGSPSNAVLDRRLTVLETRFDSVLPMLATKQDIAELRADLWKMLTEHFRWMIGLFVTLFIGMLGTNYAMWNRTERIVETHIRQASPHQSVPPAAFHAPAEAPRPPTRQ